MDMYVMIGLFIICLARVWSVHFRYVPEGTCRVCGEILPEGEEMECSKHNEAPWLG